MSKNAALYEAAIDTAIAAANAAQAGMVEDMNALDCGFAWSVSHDRGFNGYCRKKLKEITADKSATYEQRKRYGSKHWDAGWCFWSPGSFNGQAVGIHRVGAQAFSDALAHALQIRVDTGSRLD